MANAGRICLLLSVVAVLGSCGGGDAGSGEGSFQLVEFLESGLNQIPRNRDLTFVFSAPVDPVQDFPERLKIQNVQGSPGADFSKAIGTYVIVAERVFFRPRLPQVTDRSDAGFKPDANYHVFIKGGADSLRSEEGDSFPTQQEFLFDTSAFFEDPNPNEPPRVLRLLARDITTDTAIDISRADPSPDDQALLDSDELLQAGNALEPGAGGPPNYSTPWQFELHVAEPLDPATITTRFIEMYQIHENALTGPTVATPGHFGDPVLFKVPIVVEMVQRLDAQGDLEIYIHVIAQQTLVDDARYRLTFSGEILGIDYRKQFRGENGLTGDGLDITEPGGLGYVAEFLVYDRPAISATRTVTYDPITDGIQPETGQTTLDENQYNAALYNPAFNPGTAVGAVAGFGDGSDGNIAVSGGTTMTIDTGDEPNPPTGDTITVTDVDYLDAYPNRGSPAAGQIVYECYEPFDLQVENLTVSASSVLEIIGVNPCRIRARGLIQVQGRIEAGGKPGTDGDLTTHAGGAGGPGGFAGGRSPKGDKSCGIYGGYDCSSFDGFLNSCQAARDWFPFALKGGGPGRGNQGGDSYPYWAQLNSRGSAGSNDNTGSGGGGGSHATSGTAGEDRINANGVPGTPGPSCSRYGTPNSSVIGARGTPGPTYGSRYATEPIGGSGGGGGGSVGEHAFAIGAYGTSGGSGGGGGGFLEIVCAGSIFVTGGGEITVSGGQGGAGFFERNISPQYGTRYQNQWNTVSGGGGGGAGGTLALVSGGDIDVTGGLLTALGGAAGARASFPGITCNGCNAGGEGGKGFLYLMDTDGNVPGLPGGAGPAGEYDNFQYGVLTIEGFDLGRFGGISAVTELFAMPAADPDFQSLAPADIVGNVNPGQRIRVLASSSKADPDEPLNPDLATEIDPMVEVAVVRFVAGAILVELTGDMNSLNPNGGVPDRDAFVRIRADFEYDNGVEAALGPYAYMDEVTVSILFNG